MINKVLRAAVRHQTAHLEHIAHGNYESQSLTYINICHREGIPVAYRTGSTVALTVMGIILWRNRDVTTQATSGRTINLMHVAFWNFSRPFSPVADR